MIPLREFLYDLEFDFKVNKDNTISLIDLQGANLANIEEEKFEISDKLGMQIVDRLDTYIYDYHIAGIEDTLYHECQYKDDIYPYDEKLIPAMKLYPDTFDNGLIKYIEDIVTGNIDLNLILHEQKYGRLGDLVCPYCECIADESNFPDLFYGDTDDLHFKQQLQNLKELQKLGYNVVTCGECGQVFIQKL
jgi:hypothetical protein